MGGVEGRWYIPAENDGEADGFVVIGPNGEVTVTGDPGELQLTESSDSAGSFYLKDETGDRLAVAVLEDMPTGGKALRLTAPDGVVQIWLKTSVDDTSPVVHRKVGREPRRWTKEGQLGSPKKSSSKARGSAGGSAPDWETIVPEAERLKNKIGEMYQYGDGMVDVGELIELLKGESTMAALSEEEAVRLFKEVDRENTGKVAFDDFVEYFFKSIPAA